MTTRWSDPPVVERHGRALVVRDDLLPGGTKTRALFPMLIGGKATEHVYAGPAWGGGAFALSYMAMVLNHRATLFYAGRAVRAPRQRVAESYGATIEEVWPGYLTVVHARAVEHCARTGASLVDCWIPAAENRLAEIASSVDHGDARSVWCASGSGTLLRVLARAFVPRGLDVVGVQVGAAVTPPPGARIVLHQLGFERRTTAAVPFNSCRHYDAKAWECAVALAPGPFLFWNVLGDHA